MERADPLSEENKAWAKRSFFPLFQGLELEFEERSLIFRSQGQSWRGPCLLHEQQGDLYLLKGRDGEGLPLMFQAQLRGKQLELTLGKQRLLLKRP